MSLQTLKVKNLHVSVGETPILKGVNLEINQGEVHALMGPNGSGKSTLAYALVGHPKYTITEGSVHVGDTDVLELDANERARLGLFLAFQYPVTIPGVKVFEFLRTGVTNVRNPNRKEGESLISMKEFRQEMRTNMDELGIDRNFARRYLNEGFSGGEKKRMEILQMAMLKPKFAFLDETDSGLDTDAVNVVSEGVQRLAGPNNMGVLIITHHDRLLQYNVPEFTHVMLGGRIVETGGAELAQELHNQGYAGVRERHPEAAAEQEAQQETVAAK